MPDNVIDFAPLSPEERTNPGIDTGKSKAEKRAIVPVPTHVMPLRYRHPEYGDPAVSYEYRLASGELAGYTCRFDIVNADGSPDKEVLPVTYCDLGSGRFGWRAKGIPEPRPLYRLPDLLARPDAPILVCEGEKTVEAAAKRFPDYVVTTPMHGARSPHKTDWLPLAGRAVTIWPDHDDAGRDFANKVAILATAAGER
jgi:hypothetical protein